MGINSLRTALAALALSLGVASCGAEPEAPAPTAPEAPEGVSVANARLTLPAVAGNPGAVYFTVSNTGANDVMIRAVDVAGAGSALLHQTAEWNRQVDMQELFQVAVPEGEELVFEPGGIHVMVADLDNTLAVGGETEVTLSFVNGDKVSFPAAILGPGDLGAIE